MKKILLPFVKPILECIGISASSLLAVNIISFTIKICTEGWPSQASLKFKHGTFFLNEQSAGLIWGEGKTNGFILFIFIASVLYYYNKGKFPIDKTWNEKPV